MRIAGAAKRLRIYIGESDQWRGKPLYAAILETLRREGLAGATVLRGVAGFGAHSRIHTAAILRLSEDLPLIVETVDSSERIDHALTIIAPMVREGLITMEDINVIKYTHRYLQPLPGDRHVKDVMTRNVISVQINTSIADMMDLLINKLIKAVPVLDEKGKIVGIVSDGDLLERGGMPQCLSIAEKLDRETLVQQLAEIRLSNKTAADVMSRDVIAVHEDTSLAHAVQLMADNNIKRLPVLNACENLVGILSRVDILRTVAEPKPTKSETRPLANIGRTVADVMNSQVPSVKEDADLVEIVNIMVGSETKRVVVLDSNARVIGVITDGDLVERVRPEARSGLIAALTHGGTTPRADVLAHDLMSPQALKGLPDTLIEEAVQQMLLQKRKRFYVVDRDDHLLGIVDRQKLLLAIAGITSNRHEHS